PVEEPLAGGFHRGLRELGYVEGQNVIIVYRSADGRFDRLPELATALVRENVDVIVAEVTQPSLAAKNATRTIPIVMSGPGDAVAAGRERHGHLRPLRRRGPKIPAAPHGGRPGGLPGGGPLESGQRGPAGSDAERDGGRRPYVAGRAPARGSAEPRRPRRRA